VEVSEAGDSGGVVDLEGRFLEYLIGPTIINTNIRIYVPAIDECVLFVYYESHIYVRM